MPELRSQPFEIEMFIAVLPCGLLKDRSEVMRQGRRAHEAALKIDEASMMIG
jgi:hypothetical protein